MVIAIAAVVAVVLAVASGVVSFRFGISYRKKMAEAEIGSAEAEAKRIVDEAIKSGENKKREALLGAKEEIIKSRNEAEKEMKERRSEISRQERRLQQKEEALDRKTESLEKKDEILSQKIKEVEEKNEKIAGIHKAQIEILERLSGLTAEEAKEYLLKNIKDEVSHEAAMLIKEIETQAKEEADKRAKNIISAAIQRCAADHVAETTVSVVSLPNDEMKGRIKSDRSHVVL